VINGMVAAAWVCVYGRLPLKGFLSLSGICIWAVLNLLIVLAVGGAVVIGSRLLVAKEEAEPLAYQLWQTSRIVIWFPCVQLFFNDNSKLIFIPAFILAIQLGQILGRYMGQDTASSSSEKPAQSIVATPAAFSGYFPLAFLAAVSFQVAAVSAILHDMATAAGAVALATGLVLWARRSQESLRDPLKARWMRFAAVSILSLLVTVGGLMAYLSETTGFDRNDYVGNFVLGLLFRYGRPSQKAYAAAIERAYDPYGLSHGGNFSGVIFVPDKEARAILLAPRIQPQPGVFSPFSKPLKVPFHGVYWFFKPPYHRPPEHSYTTRANPVSLTLSSSDEYPLLMEAHQELSQPIALSCCREIQVTIRNADAMADSVWLELIVGSKKADQPASISLGTRPVLSKAEAVAGRPQVTSEETLRFSVPTYARLREFDEITVRFHPNPSRQFHSARIAIDSFELIPAIAQ
jgi:hypothetical protein